MDPVTRRSSAIFGRAVGARSCPRPPLLPLLPPVLASCAIRPSRRDTTTADFSCFTPFRQRPYKKKPNPPFWKKGRIQICRWSGEGGREGVGKAGQGRFDRAANEENVSDPPRAVPPAQHETPVHFSDIRFYSYHLYYYPHHCLFIYLC